MIWEPFVLALVLGLIISSGLYFAYLWPSVEPVEPTDDAVAPSSSGAPAVETTIETTVAAVTKATTETTTKATIEASSPATSAAEPDAAPASPAS